MLRRGEKVGLIGPNGSGKTTLLRTILGEVPALDGTAKIGNRVKIGYFSQSYERLKPDQTLLDNFLTEYGMTEEQTRSLLGGMLFHGDDVFKEIFEQAENFKKYEVDEESRPKAIEMPLSMTIDSEPEDTICWMVAEPPVRDDDD